MFEKRLRKTALLNSIQMKQIIGKSMVDAIFSVQQMIEKHDAAGRKLYMAFVNLEKALLRFSRRETYRPLRKKDV